MQRLDLSYIKKQNYVKKQTISNYLLAHWTLQSKQYAVLTAHSLTIYYCLINISSPKQPGTSNIK